MERLFIYTKALKNIGQMYLYVLKRSLSSLVTSLFSGVVSSIQLSPVLMVPFVAIDDMQYIVDKLQNQPNYYNKHNLYSGKYSCVVGYFPRYTNFSGYGVCP